MPILHSSTMNNIATVKPEDIFDKAFPALFEQKNEFMQKVGASYQFNILGEGGGFWVVDLKAGEVRQGREPETDCVIEMDTAVFSKFVTGRLDIPSAMKEGSLRLSGNPDYIVALGHFMGG